MTQISNEWDLSAKKYSKHVQKFFTHRRITSLLAASCNFNPKNILDFGCGPGNSTQYLAQLFPGTDRIIGVDNSQEMLNIALQNNSNGRIEFILENESLQSIKDENKIDAVFLSNSFFHLENKKELLKKLKILLTKNGCIYFSMYESVFHPENTLTWSFVNYEEDSLMSDAINKINSKGYKYEKRIEDREIFTESSLSELFENNGYNIQLSGIINLVRGKEERLSFLTVPAVSKEVFPDISQEIIDETMHELLINEYNFQQRKVFSFTAFCS